MLGHSLLLQVVDDEELPGQVSPPPNGLGLVQVRVLILVPHKNLEIFKSDRLVLSDF